jgi:quercetin dioxygenase-like cupin family protein
MRLAPLACSLMILAAVPVAAQDAVKVAAPYYQLISENDRVRVLRVTLPAGSQAAVHSHPDHVAVSMTGGTVRMTLPDGSQMDAEMKANAVSVHPAGAHGTANPGTSAHEVIVIEMKTAPGTAELPSSRPGMAMTRVLQDARVEAYRVSADSSFVEAPGTTHDYDQVVIPLAPSDIALTMDGKVTSAWQRGDVRLIGRGVPHETRGGQVKADMIIVAIK